MSETGGAGPTSGQPDILVLSLGTTLGWRAADAVFVDQSRRCFGCRHDSSHRRQRAPAAGLSGHRPRRGPRRSACPSGRASPGAASRPRHLLHDGGHARRRRGPPLCRQARRSRPPEPSRPPERRAPRARASRARPCAGRASVEPRGARRAPARGVPRRCSSASRRSLGRGGLRARAGRSGLHARREGQGPGRGLRRLGYRRRPSARLEVFGVDREPALAHLRRTGTAIPADVEFPRQDAAGGVPGGAAAKPRLRGWRSLGGLRTGAARGACGRRPGRHRALGRTVRGAGPRARAGARAGGRRGDRRFAAPGRCARLSRAAPEQRAESYRDRAAGLLERFPAP